MHYMIVYIWIEVMQMVLFVLYCFMYLADTLHCIQGIHFVHSFNTIKKM